MPVIKIELTREGVTREQKQILIKGITDLITKTLNKDPHLTHVIIQEVELDNWGYAGEQGSVIREKALKLNNKQK
ncbi:tautomerase family protein [Chryseobacterium jejuense]|uniref:Tautomerase n=1 Tax=Chryseobacterium jejuense TaxID=445960 RepID=A0A2X2VI01_CHRJE|nr:4-oxalocrotonate tautomerase family protein [Chryseobacterium jejuense]SDJ15150.1 4-oxalocrotonate tautomerase [Chryseobacterium jejuense]SQB28054.1 Probable tautomerase HP_0924 [Chryseobacterium jejuense]